MGSGSDSQGNFITLGIFELKMGICQSVGNRAGNVLRGPVAIRVVILSVLLVSDTDVVFSILFASQLIKEGGFCFVFLGGMAIGVVVYMAGVCYFGPQTKFRTVKVIKQMMTNRPADFKSDVTNPPTLVGVTTPLDPSYQSRRPFQDLKCDQEGLEDGRKSMAAWELIHLWNYAERKIALNVCEIKHGVPFVRVARFGFYAAPTPKDLGGILNANALYTVATGIFQVCGGVFLIFHVGNADLEVLLPLSISLFSLVLSLINVFADFSGALCEIENEQRLAEEVKTKNEAQRVARLRKIEDKFERERARIDSKFDGRTDVVSNIEMEKELEIATNLYSHQTQSLEKEMMNHLNHAMENYRTRMQGFRQAMKKTMFDGKKPRPGPYEEYQLAIQPYKKQKDDISKAAKESIDRLDGVALSSDELDKEVLKIRSDADKKIQILDREIEKLNVTVFGKQDAIEDKI